VIPTTRVNTVISLEDAHASVSVSLPVDEASWSVRRGSCTHATTALCTRC